MFALLERDGSGPVRKSERVIFSTDTGESDASKPNVVAKLLRDRFILHFWGRPILDAPDGPLANFDVEKFVERFLQIGRAAFDMLDGQFAIAMFDNETKEIFLARDPFGTIPLYRTRGEDWVAYSNAIQPLLKIDGISTEPNNRAINYFLREGWAPPFETFLKAISPVKPGYLEILTIEGEDLFRLSPRPSDYVKPTGRSSSTTLLRLLRRAILDGGPIKGKRVGVTLSGGIDSAAVVALLAETMSPNEVVTFTVGFGNDDPEIQGARATAKHFKTDHHELILEPRQVEATLCETVRTLENPGGYDELPCLHELWKLAAERVDVLYSGNISDAIFAGMPAHRRLWKKRLLANTFPRLAKAVPENTGYHYKSDRRSQPCTTAVQVHDEPEFVHWLDSATSLFEALQMDLESWDERTGAQTLLASRLGIELRTPFARKYLIDFALRVKDQDKVGIFGVKKIFRQAVAEILPRDIAQRRKGIQHLRYDHEMQAAILRLCRRHLEPEQIHSRGLLNPKTVVKLVRDVEAQMTAGNFRFVWNAIVLQIWAGLFLSSPPVENMSSARRPRKMYLKP